MVTENKMEQDRHGDGNGNRKQDGNRTEAEMGIVSEDKIGTGQKPRRESYHKTRCSRQQDKIVQDQKTR